MVDAVRAIPGRRFDWEAKEWWAPQADATAPYVKGVLERYGELQRLAGGRRLAGRGDPGLGRARRRGQARRRRARSCWRRSPASCPRSCAAVAQERGGRRWVPFSAATAEALLELKGSRMDHRALRCAGRLQVGQEPAPATLSLVESVGEPRFTLDVNWDPETVPAFLELPAAEAHGRSLPVDPYLLEPLEHYLRRFGVEVAPAAADVLERLRAEHDAAVEDVRASRAHQAPPLAAEAVARRRAAAVPARRRRLRAEGPPDVPGRRAGPRQDRAGAGRAGGGRRLSRPSSSVRRASSSTGSARPSAGSRTAPSPSVSGTGTVAPAAERDDPQLRDRPRPPHAASRCAGRRRSCSTSRTT